MKRVNWNAMTRKGFLVVFGALMAVACGDSGAGPDPIPGPPSPPARLGVRYRAHVEGVGWLDWVRDGQIAGTTGRSLRMEAVQIELTGPTSGARVCYSAHVQNIGWTSPVCDGLTAGTTGRSQRMEALGVLLLYAPANAHVCYRGHVQGIGWMEEVCDGTDAGTTGRGLRLEAIQVRIKP